MSLSTPKQAGLALAALLAHDRALEHVRRALRPADADAVTQLLDAPASSREARVAELLTAIRPPLAGLPGGVPPRLGGLLAARLPRPLGRAVLAEAPPPRPGFVADPALTPRLLRIVRRLAEAGAC